MADSPDPAKVPARVAGEAEHARAAGSNRIAVMLLAAVVIAYALIGLALYQVLTLLL